MLLIIFLFDWINIYSSKSIDYLYANKQILNGPDVYILYSLMVRAIPKGNFRLNFINLNVSNLNFKRYIL